MCATAVVVRVCESTSTPGVRLGQARRTGVAVRDDATSDHGCRAHAITSRRIASSLSLKPAPPAGVTNQGSVTLVSVPRTRPTKKVSSGNNLRRCSVRLLKRFRDRTADLPEDGAPPFQGGARQCPSRQQKSRLLQRLRPYNLSPLTDSNRRPPPYHAVSDRCRRLPMVAKWLV
jgi:hypothetical protein